MTIVVDTREIPSGIPDLLKQLKVPITMAQLVHGDYWVGSLPVSRKEVNDYVSSLTSGHLNTELYELSHGYGMSFLIVEGNITQALMGGGFSRDSYFSSLVGSAIKRAPDGAQGVINLISVDNKWDTALLLKHMHEKILSGEQRLPKMERSAQGPEATLVYALAAYPGIGETRARNIVKKFDGLDSLLSASVESIAEVENIGEKTAQKFYDKLHEKVKLQ